MGNLWRAYRGIATVVFTAELVFLLWLVLGTTGAGALFDRFFKPIPTATPVGAKATPAPGLPLPPATPGTQFIIEMTEAEVNALLSRHQGQVPGVQDMTVRLLPGQVNLTANVVQPIPGTVQASGNLVALDGKLRLALTQASVGPLLLPRPVVDVLEGYANDALDQALAGRNLYVEGVEVRAGLARVAVRGNGP